MDDEIFEAVTAVERQLGVNVVSIWETGSRAYNFTNTKSDIDISVLYVQPKESYILESQNLSGFSDETVDEDLNIPTGIDIDGWDITRFHELYLQYDPMIIEAINSPLTHQAPIQILRLTKHLEERVHPINIFNKYQSAAEGMYRQRLTDGKMPKKYLFHIMRAVLIARYVQKTHTLPSFDFQEFVDDAPSSIFIEFSREEVVELLSDKRDANESLKLTKPKNEEALESFFDCELEVENHIPDKTLDESFVEEQISELLELD